MTDLRAVPLLAAFFLLMTQPTDASPATPEPGSAVADFAAENVYTDDAGATVGVRWRHRSNGLSVVTLRIQSVPQVFLHVNTPPNSSRGEPHTGEHLLLGKGRKGKIVSAEQEMSLVDSTAYTSQTDVVYSWNVAAGKETFLRSVEQYLDALLLPDYDDEEVRREVCNIGVVEAEDGTLSLDEKGTIYQEMVSAYEKRWLAWYEMERRTWGADHPHSFSSGGEPSAVRTMEPHHIHEFHRDHYHLSANLGMIVALPDSIPEAEFLEFLSKVIAELDARPELAERPKKTHELPPARPQEDRSLRVVEYPNANESDVGVLLVHWPAVAAPDLRTQLLASLLVETLGGGDTATLYGRLMDSATREAEVDASTMFGNLTETKVDLGVMFGFDGFPPANLEPEKVGKIVSVIRGELAGVAKLKGGSEALGAFNVKALTKLTEIEKGLRKQLNSPPLFGHRSGGGFWLEHLRRVDRQEGYARSLTLRGELGAIRAELEAGKNPWAGAIAALGLDGEPYVTASRPSAAELERRNTAKVERLGAFLAGLERKHGEDDEQRAIAAYKAEYDAATVELEARFAELPQPHLVDDIPLVMDPSLQLDELDVAGVLGHRGVFDNMSFAEAVVSLRLDGVDPTHYPWLAILPDLLTSAGVVIGDEKVGYAEAQSRRSREIYGFGAGYAMNVPAGRHELRLTASGADAEEAKVALDWIARSLLSPWLAADNLTRIRDLVREESRNVRVTLGGREEAWVNAPAAALRYQANPLFLASDAHYTRLFNLARLEWWLTEPLAKDAAATLSSALSAVSAAAGDDVGENLAMLEKRLAEFQGESGPDQAIAAVLARIKELAADVAPPTAAVDLRRLVELASRDLAVRPADALAELTELRTGLLHRGDARFVLTGSRATTDGLRPRLAELFGSFEAHARPSRLQVGRRWIDRNLAEHSDLSQRPVHYGLVHEKGTSGVHVHSVDAAGLDDLDETTLVAGLAARVFAGAGPHSFFMSTWGAGLAYSNGTGGDAMSERQRYYAERCPDLVETMKFVVGLVDKRGAIADPYLAEYAIARAIGSTRESSGYEARTRAMADDIVDGLTDTRVRRYRSVLLGLKDRTDLWPQIEKRVADATGRVLPGIGPASREVPGGVFLTIAPAAMLEVWEGWIKAREGKEERLHRVYGRDFWTWPTESSAEPKRDRLH